MPRRSSTGSLAVPDVHAAVELHRVGVDDLAAQRLGEVEREVGLAHRRRADHRHDGDLGRGGHGSSLAHLPDCPVPD